MAYKYYNARLGLSVSVENGIVNLGATNFGTYKNAPTLTNQYGMIIPEPGGKLVIAEPTPTTAPVPPPPGLYIIYYEYGVNLEALETIEASIGSQGFPNYDLRGTQTLTLVTGVQDEPVRIANLDSFFADKVLGGVVFNSQNSSSFRNAPSSSDRAYILPEGSGTGQILYHDLFLFREDNDIVVGYWNMPYVKRLPSGNFVSPEVVEQIRHEVNGLPKGRELLLVGTNTRLKELSAPILISNNKPVNSAIKTAFSISDGSYDSERFMDCAFSPLYLTSFSFDDEEGECDAEIKNFITSFYFGGDYYGGFSYPKSWSGVGVETSSVNGEIQFQAATATNPQKAYEEAETQKRDAFSEEALRYVQPEQTIPFTVTKTVRYTPYQMDYDNDVASWNTVPWIDFERGASVGTVVSINRENLRFITPPFAHSDVDGLFPIYSTVPDQSPASYPTGHVHAVRQNRNNLLSTYSDTDVLAKGYLGFDNCNDRKFGYAYFPTTTSTRVGETSTYTIIQPSYTPESEVDTYATIYKSEYWSTAPEVFEVDWELSGSGSIAVEVADETYNLNFAISQTSSFSLTTSFEEKHHVGASSICDSVTETTQDDVTSIILQPPWYDPDLEKLRSFGIQFGNMISYGFTLNRGFFYLVAPGGGELGRIEDYDYVEKTMNACSVSKTGTMSLTGSCPGTGRELRDVYTINENYNLSAPLRYRQQSNTTSSYPSSSPGILNERGYGFAISNSFVVPETVSNGYIPTSEETITPLGSTVQYPCNRSHKSSRLLTQIGDTQIIREVEFDLDYTPRLFMDTTRYYLESPSIEQTYDAWSFGASRSVRVGNMFGVGDERTGSLFASGQNFSSQDRRFYHQVAVGSPQPIDIKEIGIDWYNKQTLTGNESLSYYLWSGLTPAPLHTSPRCPLDFIYGAYGARVNSYSDKMFAIINGTEYEIDELGSLYIDRCDVGFDIIAEDPLDPEDVNDEFLDRDFGSAALIDNLLSQYENVYIDNLSFYEFSFTDSTLYFSNQNQYVYTKDENQWDALNAKTRLFIDTQEPIPGQAVKDVAYVGEKGYQNAYKQLEGEIIDLVGSNYSFDRFSDALSNIENNKALRVVRCIVEEVEDVQFIPPESPPNTQVVPNEPIRGEFDWDMMAIPAPQYGVTTTIATNIYNAGAGELNFNKFALNPTGFATFSNDTQRSANYTPLYGFELNENEDDIFSTRSFSKPPISIPEYTAGVRDELRSDQAFTKEEQCTAAEYGTTALAFQVPVTLGRKPSSDILYGRGAPLNHVKFKRLKVLQVFDVDGYLTAINGGCRKDRPSDLIDFNGAITICTPNNLNHLIAREYPNRLVVTNMLQFDDFVYGLGCLNTEFLRITEDEEPSTNGVVHTGTTISTIDGIWFDVTDNKFKKAGNFKYQKLVLRASETAVDNGGNPVDFSFYKPVEVGLFNNAEIINVTDFTPDELLDPPD